MIWVFDFSRYFFETRKGGKTSSEIPQQVIEKVHDSCQSTILVGSVRLTH